MNYGTIVSSDSRKNRRHCDGCGRLRSLPVVLWCADSGQLEVDSIETFLEVRFALGYSFADSFAPGGQSSPHFEMKKMSKISFGASALRGGATAARAVLLLEFLRPPRSMAGMWPIMISFYDDDEGRCVP